MFQESFANEMLDRINRSGFDISRIWFKDEAHIHIYILQFLYIIKNKNYAMKYICLLATSCLEKIAQLQKRQKFQSVLK